jgi:hypothetical protein
LPEAGLKQCTCCPVMSTHHKQTGGGGAPERAVCVIGADDQATSTAISPTTHACDPLLPARCVRARRDAGPAGPRRGPPPACRPCPRSAACGGRRYGHGRVRQHVAAFSAENCRSTAGGRLPAAGGCPATGDGRPGGGAAAGPVTQVVRPGPGSLVIGGVRASWPAGGRPRGAETSSSSSQHHRPARRLGRGLAPVQDGTFGPDHPGGPLWHRDRTHQRTATTDGRRR